MNRTTPPRTATHRSWLIGGREEQHSHRPQHLDRGAARTTAAPQRTATHRIVPDHGRTSRGACIEPPASASTTAPRRTAPHRTASIGGSR